MSTSHDLYRPPDSNLTDPASDQTGEALVTALRSESTFALLALGILTIGVYWAHYVHSKTLILNRFCPEAPISMGLIGTLYVASYLGVAVLVGLVFGALQLIDPVTVELLDGLSSLTDLTSSLAFLIWAFGARSRLNRALGSAPGDPRWFHGFWTFFFVVLYINFKINRICDSIQLQRDTRSSGVGAAA